MRELITIMELLEKIVRAKVRLEQMKRPHSERCIVELDPDSTAPCDCGASQHNASVTAALKELSLDE